MKIMTAYDNPVNPARAGMIPGPSPPSMALSGKPRASGDDPGEVIELPKSGG